MFPVVPSIAEVPGEYSSFILDLKQRIQHREGIPINQQRIIFEGRQLPDIEPIQSITILDKTFYYLNQCIDKRMGPVTYFLEYPAYKGIKNDARYTELLKRQGFTEELIQMSLQ